MSMTISNVLVEPRCLPVRPSPSAAPRRPPTRWSKYCKKDGEFLIGFSQANNAEPYRQHVNDELTAAAKEVPQLHAADRRRRRQREHPDQPGRQLHHAEGRSAADLAVRGGADDAGGEAGDGCRHSGDRARPQDGRRSGQGLHGLHRRRQLQDRRGGGRVHREDAAARRRRRRGAGGPAELDAGGRAAERLQGRREGQSEDQGRRRAGRRLAAGQGADRLRRDAAGASRHQDGLCQRTT